MKSTLDPLEGNKVKLSVEVDEAEFDRDIEAAFRKIAREVRIPGFRAGKAPRRVLEARIGIAPAREQALQDAIPQYIARAVREHDVDVIAPPEVEITGGREEGAVAFEATVEVRPQIIVPGYAGLRVEVPSIEVGDDEIDALIDAERRRGGDLVDVERPIESGDYVVVDLSGTRNGEPVPGLNAEDWSYEVGRGWISPDFDPHLLGAQPGDERTFTTTPNGTDESVELSVSVKKVQQLELPELTDEWVERTVGFETIAEWRDAIRTRLGATRLNTARQAVVQRTLSALAGLVDDDPPKALVDPELRSRIDRLAGSLQHQNVPLEQYLAMTGQTQETLVEGLRADAEEAVKVDLALRAVAEAEALDVDDEALEAEYARVGAEIGQKPDKVRRVYERSEAVGELRAQLRTRRALEWLLRRVEIVDPDGRVIERSALFNDDEVAEAATHATHEHDHEHESEG